MANYFKSQKRKFVSFYKTNWSATLIDTFKEWSQLPKIVEIHRKFVFGFQLKTYRIEHKLKIKKKSARFVALNVVKTTEKVIFSWLVILKMSFYNTICCRASHRTILRDEHFHFISKWERLFYKIHIFQFLFSSNAQFVCLNSF